MDWIKARRDARFVMKQALCMRQTLADTRYKMKDLAQRGDQPDCGCIEIPPPAGSKIILQSVVGWHQLPKALEGHAAIARSLGMGFATLGFPGNCGNIVPIEAARDYILPSLLPKMEQGCIFLFDAYSRGVLVTLALIERMLEMGYPASMIRSVFFAGPIRGSRHATIQVAAMEMFTQMKQTELPNDLQRLIDFIERTSPELYAALKRLTQEEFLLAIEAAKEMLPIKGDCTPQNHPHCHRAYRIEKAGVRTTYKAFAHDSLVSRKNAAPCLMQADLVLPSDGHRSIVLPQTLPTIQTILKDHSHDWLH